MTRTCRPVNLLVFGAATLCAGAAHAQAQAGSASSDRFTLDARGSVSYQSNVAGGDDTLASIRGLEPEDIIYSAGISVGLQRPSSRQNLFLTARADINRHDKNKRLDGENLSVQAGATRRFTACAVTGAAGYARQQSLPDELTVVSVSKNVAETRNASLQSSCGFGHIVGSVAGQVSKTSNNAKSSGYVDSRTEAVTTSIGYANESLGTLSLFAQISKNSYNDNRVAGSPLARDFRQTSGGVSYARDIGSRLNGKAAVSYTMLDSDLPGGDTDGFTADAALDYRLSSRTALTLNYSRGYQASATLFASSRFTERLGMSTSYKLSSRLSARGSISEARNDYRGSSAALLQVSDDKVFNAGAGLSYRIGRKISIDLDGGYSERNADLDLFDSHSTRATISVSSRF